VVLGLEDFEGFEWIIVGVFAGCILVQWLYFVFFFLRVSRHKSTNDLPDRPVSVVICAKNEEKNLRELIPQLMEQKHPEFQIVVVNDASWDTTKETLDALQVSFPALHVTHLDEDKQRMSGKKFALTLGIKAAKHETVLLTDADCRPSSRSWISEMTRVMDDQRRISIGFGGYTKLPGLLNKIIRFDTFQIAMYYLSFSKAGIPYMGVGRNLAYEKTLFFDQGGFRRHFHIPSGDDDLFVSEAANKKNTTISIAPDAHTLSEPKKHWSSWLNQKRRHITTASHYKAIHKILLSLYPLSWLFLSLSFIFLLVIKKALMLVIAIFLTRYLLQIAIFRGSSNSLGNQDVVWLSPLLEPMLMILNLTIYLSNILNKPKQWK